MDKKISVKATSPSVNQRTSNEVCEVSVGSDVTVAYTGRRTSMLTSSVASLNGAVPPCAVASAYSPLTAAIPPLPSQARKRIAAPISPPKLGSGTNRTRRCSRAVEQQCVRFRNGLGLCPVDAIVVAEFQSPTNINGDDGDARLSTVIDIRETGQKIRDTNAGVDTGRGIENEGKPKRVIRQQGRPVRDGGDDKVVQGNRGWILRRAGDLKGEPALRLASRSVKTIAASEAANLTGRRSETRRRRGGFPGHRPDPPHRSSE